MSLSPSGLVEASGGVSLYSKRRLQKPRTDFIRGRPSQSTLVCHTHPGHTFRPIVGKILNPGRQTILAGVKAVVDLEAGAKSAFLESQ
jgi:hypothetical protein